VAYSNKKPLSRGFFMGARSSMGGFLNLLFLNFFAVLLLEGLLAMWLVSV
jgi:hypothetical protein